MKALQAKIFKPTIPLITINGAIDTQMVEKFMYNLKKVKTRSAVALAVSVNSPGGYPSQSHIIASQLRSFADKNKLKLYTFASDQAASGGYAILCIGDEVYAHRGSLVGNIGVVWKRYSLAGGLEFAGIEHHRLESQITMQKLQDPLLPFEAEDKSILQDICSQSHAKFINFVQTYRKEKIREKKVFDGDVFSGEEALKLGLIDGLGTVTEVLSNIHPEARIDLIVEKQSLSNRVIESLL